MPDLQAYTGINPRSTRRLRKTWREKGETGADEASDNRAPPDFSTPLMLRRVMSLSYMIKFLSLLSWGSDWKVTRYFACWSTGPSSGVHASLLTVARTLYRWGYRYIYSSPLCKIMKLVISDDMSETTMIILCTNSWLEIIQVTWPNNWSFWMKESHFNQLTLRHNYAWAPRCLRGRCRDFLVQVTAIPSEIVHLFTSKPYPFLELRYPANFSTHLSMTFQMITSITCRSIINWESATCVFWSGVSFCFWLS